MVTGATGTNGTEILKRLATADVQVRAMVRNLGHASAIALPYVEVVQGDFDRPETLLAALDGVERAFLLTGSSERAESQQIAFIDAARRSGVAHVVKLSQFDADANAPGRFQRYHAAVEAALQESGLAFTILRPNLYMQGLLNFRSTIATQNAFYVTTRTIGAARQRLSLQGGVTQLEMHRAVLKNSRATTQPSFPDAWHRRAVVPC